MKKYFLGKNLSEEGFYEVHLDSCYELPSVENLIGLGFQDSHTSALAEAKKLYPEVSEKIQGCKACLGPYLAAQNQFSNF